MASSFVISSVTAFSVALLSLIAVAGWSVGSPSATPGSAGGVTMKMNTAIALFLASVALLLANVRAGPRILANGCAGAVTLLAFLTLLEYAFGWDLHLDQAVAMDHSGVGLPGRMAPLSAIALFLLGASLLCPHRRERCRMSQGAALLAFFVMLPVLIGHVYGLRVSVGLTGAAGVAAQTAVAVSLLSLGILSLHPQQGIMKILTDPSPAGRLTRRLGMAACVLFLLVGWVRVVGERAGLYDGPSGMVMHMALNLLIVSALVLWSAEFRLSHSSAERRNTAPKQTDRRLVSPWPLLGFATGVVILSAVGILSYRGLDENRATAEAMELSRIRLNALQDLLDSLRDAETGQRGYLLTNRWQYLTPYVEGRAHVDGYLERLIRSFQDEPERRGALDLLRDLTRDKFDELQQTITLTQAGRVDDARQILQTDRGKATMDQIRNIVSDLSGSERVSLRDRSAERVRAEKRLNFLALLGIVLALIFIATGVVLLHSEAARPRRSEKALARSEIARDA